jgi:hypothetical protein
LCIISICPVDEVSEPTFFLNYGKRALGRREREIVGERERERPGYSLFSDSGTSGSLVEWSLGISERVEGWE